MKISIITVCYNSCQTIRDTLESVLSQTYDDIEYIVIDGDSRDGTRDIIEQYRSRLSFFLSEPDSGMYDALNKGIMRASGAYIGILNSDDVFFSTTTIAELAVFLGAHSGADACYADLIYVKRDDVSRIVRKYSSSNFRVWKMRFGAMIPHPTFYAKRELFERVGMYRTDYRVAADFELMARFLIAHVTVVRFPSVIVKMRYGGISTTGLKWIIHQNLEIVRACRENGIYTNIFMISMKLPSKFLSFILK